MLVTFSCKEYENITMFGDVAKRLLELMGHSTTVPGAILAADVPDALESLEKAVAQEKSKSTDPHKVKNVINNADEDDSVSLAHRALPLINMLKAADKHQCNIMWR